MRKTLTLDDEAYSLAKRYAEANKMTLGQALSYLIMESQAGQSDIRIVDGLPSVPGRRPLTPELVKDTLD